MTVIEIIGFIGSSLVIWDHVPQIIPVQRTCQRRWWNRKTERLSGLDVSH